MALIPYITAGYPDAAHTARFLTGAAAAGADFVEVGVPWSDPVADGPVIQASSRAALAGGASLAATLELVANGAAVAPPIIIFSYLNPLLAFGCGRFATAATRAGAAAILVTDLPFGADPAMEAELAGEGGGLPLIRLVAPTTAPERLSLIARNAAGFIYLVARAGVTGVSATLAADTASRVAALRSGGVPVAVGFGIGTPAQAAEVARYADGVVVGSAVVERMGSGGADAALEWLAGLRVAMDRAA